MIKIILEIMIYNCYGIHIYNKKIKDGENITTDGKLWIIIIIWLSYYYYYYIILK